MKRAGCSNDSGDARHRAVKTEKTITFEITVFAWVKGEDAMLYHPQ